MKKRILAAVLTLVMVFALCAAAQADETAADDVNEVTEATEDVAAEATAEEAPEVSGDEIAVIIDGTEYTVDQMNYEYMKTYMTFLQNYGSYAAYFGFDTSADPADQDFGDGTTWKDYFMDDAVYQIKVTRELTALAKELGLEVTDEEKQQILDYIDSYEASLVESGYESFDAVLAEIYGPGVTKSMIVQDNISNMLIQKAYYAKAEEIENSITDEEIAADPRIDVRHVLIQAEADENGEFTEKALARAKYRAEAVMRIYERGDMTEESFAALAEEYSEDPGSSSNGGLYEGVAEGQMVEEFNDFCFDEARQPGDTGIVYGTNGSYAGYHVMYFVGKNLDAAREELVDEKMSEWYSGLVTDESYEKTEFYDSVGAIA